MAISIPGNSHIATLISAGADAMTNMFEVLFTPPGSIAGENLRVRTKGFTPPSPTQSSYDVHWKTISIKKPATKIELDRVLDFEIRIDANYDVYKALLAWQALSSASAAGYAANAPELAGRIEVRALSTPITSTMSAGALEDDITAADSLTWIFEDVWIENIAPSAYSAEDAAPVTVTAKFRYGKYSDPQIQ